MSNQHSTTSTVQVFSTEASTHTPTCRGSVASRRPDRGTWNRRTGRLMHVIRLPQLHTCSSSTTSCIQCTHALQTARIQIDSSQRPRRSQLDSGLAQIPVMHRHLFPVDCLQLGDTIQRAPKATWRSFNTTHAAVWPTSRIACSHISA